MSSWKVGDRFQVLPKYSNVVTDGVVYVVEDLSSDEIPHLNGAPESSGESYVGIDADCVQKLPAVDSK